MLSANILSSSDIQLEPLNQAHENELYQIAQDERIWAYTPSNALGENFSRWFNKALLGMQNQTQLAFAVRRLSDNKLLGSTRCYDIDTQHKRLTVGYTWYIPEVWGSHVNTQCKLLLLTFIFETLQMNRAEFTVDVRNIRSRQAVQKLGATQEGILRQHMVLESGLTRDSVIFSIIRPEWLEVKAVIEKRLGRQRGVCFA